MSVYVVALICELFLSVASSLIHETSPFGVKTTLFLATFVEYYEHTHTVIARIPPEISVIERFFSPRGIGVIVATGVLGGVL